MFFVFPDSKSESVLYIGKGFLFSRYLVDKLYQGGLVLGIARCLPSSPLDTTTGLGPHSPQKKAATKKYIFRLRLREYWKPGNPPRICHTVPELRFFFRVFFDKMGVGWTHRYTHRSTDIFCQWRSRFTTTTFPVLGFPLCQPSTRKLQRTKSPATLIDSFIFFDFPFGKKLCYHFT